MPPTLLAMLTTYDQQHVLYGWDGLPAQEQRRFTEELERLPFAELAGLYASRTQPQATILPLDAIHPLPLTQPNADCIDTGEAALRAGQVAVLLVAGGQGTRLGFDKPKGMYPVGPLSGASLFQIHAEKVLALSRRYGTPLQLLVMTSSATHADTVEFFGANHRFGLSEHQLHFFQQGEMPALDLTTGRLLLEAPGRLVSSPNGHGGTLTALASSGLLARLKADGVQHLFYFQVDNAFVNIAAPAFVGAHIAAGADVSSKVVAKVNPAEKVGVLALIHNRCGIIEYSDMPAALNEQRDADGQLSYRAGNPAIHLFSVPFLERVTTGCQRLEYHLARKKVPYFDTSIGADITPTLENALKFELFIFDALPLAERWLAVETQRADEFAPLKNASGNDSPATVHELMFARNHRWLAAAGLSTGHPVEISPLYALDAAELKAKAPVITGPTMLQ